MVEDTAGVAATDTHVHSAADLPHDQRVEYLRVLAALAGADGILRGGELGALAAYCDRLNVDPASRASIFEAARTVNTKRISATCERYRTSDLRYALLTDLLVIAMTDRTYGDAERQIVEAIAELLDVPAARLPGIEAFADRLVRTIPPLPKVEVIEALLARERTVNIGGVAAGVVATFGAALGMSLRDGPPNLVHGLETLGLGQGLVVGLLVATAIGAIGFFSARGVLNNLLPRPVERVRILA